MLTAVHARFHAVVSLFMVYIMTYGIMTNLSIQTKYINQVLLFKSVLKKNKKVSFSGATMVIRIYFSKSVVQTVDKQMFGAANYN